MVTISHVIKDILKRNVLLQEAITQDIVSFNKLAERLKPEIESELGKKISKSAIVMALRRGNAIPKIDAKTIPFSYSIETIKTDICYILLEESVDLLHKLRNLYSIIDFKKGGILNIIQGNFEVAIITNKKYEDELLDLLHDEKVLDKIDDLICISLTFSDEFLYSPGVIYDVSRFLAFDNINIIDFILTKTEMSIIISKKDFLKAYKSIRRFAENKEESKELFESIKQ